MTPDPDPARTGAGYDTQMTSYTYDSVGRLATVVQPDTSVVTNEYFPNGRLKKTSGSRTYHQEFTYDSQGRIKTLKTWQNFSAATGPAITTWNYHTSRGWLISKRYADNKGPTYSYYASGRLNTRTWARGNVTTYSYNNAVDIASINYSDTTPGVALTYDRRGRLLTTADAAGALSRSYDPTGMLQNEVYGTTGLLANISVNRTFDLLGRLSTIGISQTSTPVVPSTGYGYDATSRLQTVTSGTAAANYTYSPNASLVQTIAFSQGGAIRLTSTKVYDLFNRISSITNIPSVATASAITYDYNGANQRTKLTRDDGSYWEYGYDMLGQLVSGQKKLSSGILLSGYDYGYVYDDIGNRKTTTINGQAAVYTPTSLNQYTKRTIPGSVDVTGAAAIDATVTVNSQPTQRQGERFYRSIPVNNATAPQNTTLTIVGAKNNAGPAGEDTIAQTSKQAFVAKSPEVYTYDADGNLTADARWLYTWDAENRLTSMTTQTSASATGAANQKLVFTYDAQGRRIQKTVSNWNGSLAAWGLQSDTRFIYDGWNLLADLDGQNSNTPVCAYVWGVDLSGSLQGAGGVGGLLLTTKAGSTYGVSYDGNGNLLGLINLSDGTRSADFEYDPFGNTIKATGAAANVCPFGFSTKYADSETGLLYYGFRYYNPEAGRWMSRDPIEEKGGVDLYDMVGNSVVGTYDWLGLIDQCKCKQLHKLLQQAYVETNVYTDQNGRVPGAENYERLSDDQLRELGLHGWSFRDGSGFYSALYLDHDTGAYTVAFRGTEGIFAGHDWITNFAQSANLPVRQYQSAADLGTQLGEMFEGNIFGIGHSLGGGLDTVAALSGNFSATNFNPAGVSMGTAHRLGIDLGQSQRLVNNYSVPGDLLSQVLNRLPFVPSTDGNRVMLEDPGDISILGINRHLMGDVVQSIKNELRKNHCN